MKFISFVDPPYLIKKIFSQFIWENSDQKICLTIDDGPFPEPTEKILKVLSQYKSKAIFFLTGKNVVENYRLVDEIISEGHFIANHSFNHSRNMMMMSRDELKKEILETERLLNNKLNFLKIFRPPYGRINLRMFRELKSLNYKIMMWSLLTEDFRGEFELVKRNLNKYLKNNSIIVFHNNPKSVHIIEKSIDYALNLTYKRGYEIGNTFTF